jgi:hypothetical protein
MNSEYKGHTYRIEVHGKASQAKGYRLERIFLWVDEKQIEPASGTYFEPSSTSTRQKAWEHADNAAKRIIEHLVETGKTVNEL